MIAEKPTSIRFPTPEMKKAIEKLAAAENRGLSNYIIHILKKVIEKKGKI